MRRRRRRAQNVKKEAAGPGEVLRSTRLSSAPWNSRKMSFKPLENNRRQQPITAVWQHTPAGREECVLLPQITSKRPSSSQTVEHLFCGLDGQVRASSLQPGSLAARRFSQDSPNVEVVCPWVQPEWKSCATDLILEIFMLLKSETPTANTHVRVDKVFSTVLRVSDIHEFFWTLLYL